MQRWKWEYGISLRKPTVKYKCSKSKLLGRLRAMWLTTVRLRALAEALLGHDLICWGFDQKPLHMNEMGSKNTGTLHLMGAEVRLKENHAATRQRFSLMTSVTSSAEEALAGGGPPLEVCFLGKTRKVIQGITLPSGLKMHPP